MTWIHILAWIVSVRKARDAISIRNSLVEKIKAM
jgi:hypothetical protein